MADYTPTTQERNCLFCGIVEGSVPARIFWENDAFMAFLTPFPNCKGNTVLIPKRHVGSDVLAMPSEELAAFVAAAQEVSEILKTYFDDVGRVGLIMEGTGIDHAHIKLYPMHGTEYMKKGEWKQIHSGVDTYFDTYAGYLSSNDGPKADEKELDDLVEGLRNVYS
jgi:histidine triad (HIT) family protein